MHALTRSVIMVALLLISVISVSAQSQPQVSQAKEPTASIAGQVTIGGRPAAGVIVTLTEANPESLKAMTERDSPESMLKATTDAGGYYRLERLAAGRYLMTPFAPAFVIQKEQNSNKESGRVINLNDGEAREKVDFTITRGGVITGRVTDANGRPVIEARIKLTVIDETTNNPLRDYYPVSPREWLMYMTDDRGIYRIYGVPAGRYIVSVGAAEGEQGYSFKSRYHTQTFHPGVADRTKAAILELKEGGEVTGIDIKLGLASQTYSASGRVVDADTGKPIQVAATNYGPMRGNNRMISSSGLNAPVNSKGEFKISSLMPGRYYVCAGFDEDVNSYSDLTQFEITSGDVAGLVVKVRRGQVVSGTISIEGTNDPEALASLPQLRFYASASGAEPTAPRSLTLKVAPDGSFRIPGVQPGKLYIHLYAFSTPAKLAVLRVERNGVVQPEGVQISANENPSDVRIVLAKAGGVMRGQINFVGGSIPDNVTIEVNARRQSGSGYWISENQEVDASGRFMFENLLPGEYELTIDVRGVGTPIEVDKRPSTEFKRVVTVTNEVEANVAFTVDFNPKKQ